MNNNLLWACIIMLSLSSIFNSLTVTKQGELIDELYGLTIANSEIILHMHDTKSAPKNKIPRQNKSEIGPIYHRF